MRPADSEGVAAPHEWEAVVRRHGAEPRFPAHDRRRFPHDIAINARYDRALRGLPQARRPWTRYRSRRRSGSSRLPASRERTGCRSGVDANDPVCCHR